LKNHLPLAKNAKAIVEAKVAKGRARESEKSQAQLRNEVPVENDEKIGQRLQVIVQCWNNKTKLVTSNPCLSLPYQTKISDRCLALFSLYI